MQVEFLGTGSSLGIPVIGCTCPVCSSVDSRDTRLRCSALVRIQETTILIDAGPDLRQQMLASGATKIHAVLLTHSHKDHIGGIDDLRPFNYIQSKSVDIYAEKPVCDAIRNEFFYVFEDNPYPGVPKLSLLHINTAPFSVEGQMIFPIRGLHGKLPVLGFRIGDFAYLTDMSFISVEEKAKLHGVHTLVVNALRDKSHFSHFSLQQALSLINDISPKQAYLTHLSHEFGLHAIRSQDLPENVHIAFDRLIISVP